MSEARGAAHVLAEGVLAGKVALVSGAGTGIGRAVSLRLVALGARVVGVGRRPEPLAETAALAGPAFTGHSLNVRDEAAVRSFVDALGTEHGLDILVNNAGGQFVARASEISDGGMRAVLDLNLTAVARMTALARPWLADGGGTVVTISLSSPDRGIPGLAHSAVARSAIVGLTSRLAEEWRDEGIRLYCLAPGTVLTDGVRDELTESALAAVLERTPLGRDTSVDEVAEWVAALAAGIAPAASGSLIELDGGAGLLGAVGALGIEPPGMVARAGGFP
jgi:citronellol/citronellal dehydrogenase